MSSDLRRPRVVLHTDAPEEAREVVAANHPDLPVDTCSDHDALPDLLQRTLPEVVYTVRFGATEFPRRALLDCASVEWISVGGSGTDHLSPWDSDAVTVTNSAGVAAPMMAQYALGAMLSFSLRFPEFASDQRLHRWSGREVEPLDGKTVLIVGLGHTGRAVSALAGAVGLHVLGVRANPCPTEGVDEVHAADMLPELWGRADFIVISVPLLETTKGLVDAAAFAAMKPSSVLIDLSRGSIVVEAALLRALDEGTIRGAALDVFETEPLPADNPLWDRENVIITPHCSAVFPGWQRASVAMFCDNLHRYRQGKPLENIVSQARGY